MGPARHLDQFTDFWQMVLRTKGGARGGIVFQRAANCANRPRMRRVVLLGQLDAWTQHLLQRQPSEAFQQRQIGAGGCRHGGGQKPHRRDRVYAVFSEPSQGCFLGRRSLAADRPDLLAFGRVNQDGDPPRRCRSTGARAQHRRIPWPRPFATRGWASRRSPRR